MSEATYVVNGRRLTLDQIEAEKAKQDARLRANPRDPAAVAAQRAWNASLVSATRQEAARAPAAPTAAPTGIPNADGTYGRQPYTDSSQGGALFDTPVTLPSQDPESVDKPDDPDQRNAMALLRRTLASYGLEELADWAWQQIINGASPAEVELGMRDTEPFKRRFPAIQRVREFNAANPTKQKTILSPGQYVEYEKTARQLFREAGLPAGFYDSNDDFTELIFNDVSPRELGRRVDGYRKAAYSTDAQTLSVLARDYGITPDQLAAVYVDPQRGIEALEQQYLSSQIGGSAERSGFGATTREENEALAKQGITADQAQEGFGDLAGQRELFTPLDAGEDSIGRDEQIGATFRSDANSRRRIEQRARRRTAQFQAGGDFATGQRGAVGLGSAS